MKEIGIAELVKVGDISNDEEFRSNNISIVEARQSQQVRIKYEYGQLLETGMMS